MEAAKSEAHRLGAFLAADRKLNGRIETLRRLIENDLQILSIHSERELRDSISVAAKELTEEQMAQAGRARAMCLDKLKMLRQKEKQLQEERVNRNASYENPMVPADRMEAIRAELSEGEEYYAAVKLAIDGLQAASDAMRGNITPAISRNAGKMMEYISDGRYSELKAGRSLTVSLSDESALVTSEEMISGGTGDAAYIALRIALMMQIFERELPPLLMDEALCQTDDNRMRRILLLLGKLAESGWQCLIFTCHRREGEACLFPWTHD